MKDDISRCSDEQQVLLKNEQNLQRQIDDVKQEIKSLYVLVGIGIACSSKGTVPGSLADVSSMLDAADGSKTTEEQDSKVTEEQSASAQPGKEDVAPVASEVFPVSGCKESPFRQVH